MILRNGTKLWRTFAMKQQILLQPDEILNRLYDFNGDCERIKRTYFPGRFAYHTRIHVRVLATLFPLTMIVTEEYFDVFAVLVEAFLAFILVTIQRLGQELNDSFENKPNDTPLSTICRTAEINLRGVPVAGTLVLVHHGPYRPARPSGPGGRPAEK
jgi:putative membrane protein